MPRDNLNHSGEGNQSYHVIGATLLTSANDLLAHFPHAHTVRKTSGLFIDKIIIRNNLLELGCRVDAVRSKQLSTFGSNVCCSGP